MTLRADFRDIEDLEDRLARGSFGRTTSERFKRLQKLRNEDPLYQMSLRIPRADVERKLRRQKRGEPLVLCVTVGRHLEGEVPDLSGLVPPALDFKLEKLVLYQSILRPEGAEYLAVAESCSFD